jgi:hypothetical protein
LLIQASSLKMSAATEVDKMAALATAANEARGLAMDSIAVAPRLDLFFTAPR